MVDDDELVRDSYAQALAARGHDVTAAEGRRALKLLGTGPDVLVVDILMPDVDGIELIVAAQKQTPVPRIIAISGGGKFSADHCLLLAQSLGATIALRKPVDPVELEAAVNADGLSRVFVPNSSPMPSERRAAPSILAVDDDPMVLDLLRLYLWNYELGTANSGAEALSTLEHSRPDLMLLDVKMPSMDGVETLRNVRRRPHLRSMRVMMLTALADRPTISKAVAAGADGYMLKPFTRENLVHRVNQLLRKSDRNHAEV